MSHHRPPVALRLGIHPARTDMLPHVPLLGTRQYVAQYAHRHVDQITRRCQPIACDVPTRTVLYDVHECLEIFGVSGVSLHRKRTA